MEITYTAHAVERMMQRGISPQEVELLLSKPDGTIKQSMDKFIYYKQVKGRKDNALAAVTVKIENNRFEVITVMINFEVPK
jgi:hypothetical protein